MSSFDTVNNILIFGGAISLILCGIYIAKPNFYDSKFEEGHCTIHSTEQDLDYLPKCSCGKNCNTEYPCARVYGSFQSAKSNFSFEVGTFHKSYNALKKKCLVVPKCSRDFDRNAGRVYNFWYTYVASKVGDTRYPSYKLMYNMSYVNYTDTTPFPCWGYENFMYFEHSYSALKAILALAIPGICIVLGLLTTTCTSDQNKEFVVSVFSLPFLIIFGIFGCIAEILGCEGGLSGIRSCCKQNDATESPARSRRNTIDIEVSTFTQQFRSSVDDRRRRSMSLSSLDSVRSRVFERRHSAGELILNSAYPITDPNIYPAGIVSTAPPPSYLETTATGDLPPPPSYNDVMNS